MDKIMQIIKLQSPEDLTCHPRLLPKAATGICVVWIVQPYF